MFTSYWDASGNRDGSALTIAGFVSRVSKWEKFEEDWPKLLPSSVSMFHMTDFVSSKNGWESYKGKSAERIEIMDSLVSCIGRNTNKGFAASIELKHYKKLNRKYEVEESWGGPYPLLGVTCLSQLKLWADKKGIPYGNILCVFEEGDADQGKFLLMAKRLGFNATSQNKSTIRAFDAADLAAWKARNAILDLWDKKLHLKGEYESKRLRDTFDKVNKMIRNNGMFQEASLEKVLIDQGAKLRSQTA